MEIDFSDNALTDLDYWKQKGTVTIKARITKLIEAIRHSPFTGIGKPEPLRYELSGKWSRRIDDKNRIVYNVINQRIKIYSLRGHYGNK
jgi:toxin YoeB